MRNLVEMVVGLNFSNILYFSNIPDDVACIDPDVCDSVCENEAACTNIAYPIIVSQLLPDGKNYSIQYKNDYNCVFLKCFSILSIMLLFNLLLLF